MNQTERRLLRHVMAAVAIKLIALAVLWHAFVRGETVSVDGERTAVRLGVAVHPRPAPGASK